MAYQSANALMAEHPQLVKRYNFIEPFTPTHIDSKDCHDFGKVFKNTFFILVSIIYFLLLILKITLYFNVLFVITKSKNQNDIIKFGDISTRDFLKNATPPLMASQPKGGKGRPDH